MADKTLIIEHKLDSMKIKLAQISNNYSSLNCYIMKKILLLLLISIVGATAYAQINLVNDGHFINTGITGTITGPATTIPGMGVWYPSLSTSNQGEIYITSVSGRNNRNAAGIKIITTNVGSFNRGLAQRVAAPDNGIYRLGFWAKYTTVVAGQTPYFRGMLLIDDSHRPGSPLYFSRTDASSVTKDFYPSTSWKYFTQDFDLSKKATKDGYTESFVTTNADIQDFSVYFSNFVQARGADIQITGVTLIKVDNTATPAAWYNPGFEESFAVPTLVYSTTGTPIRAQETTTKGIWALALMDGITDPAKSQATILTDATESNTGTRSMKLNVKKVVDFSKVVLATTLFNLPKDDYVFSFYAKTDIDAVPFRIDVDNYDITKVSAKNGFPFSDQASVKENKISSTSWTKYEVHFNNTTMSDTLSLAIRPNITPTGSPINGAENWTDTEVNYWFDDFSIEIDLPTNTGTISDISAMRVVTLDKTVIVSSVNSVVELIDLNGRVLDRKVPYNNEVLFNVRDRGIYIIRSEGCNKKVVVR